jgi:hypothetical protein
MDNSKRKKRSYQNKQELYMFDGQLKKEEKKLPE